MSRTSGQISIMIQLFAFTSGSGSCATGSAIAATGAITKFTTAATFTNQRVTISSLAQPSMLAVLSTPAADSMSRKFTAYELGSDHSSELDRKESRIHRELPSSIDRRPGSEERKDLRRQRGGVFLEDAGG